MTNKPALSAKEARDILWHKGILEWKLDATQKELNASFKNSPHKTFVWSCSRRLGKSYTLCTLAIEQCLKKDFAIVKYVAPTQKAVKMIIKPLLRQILQDCPPILRPEFKTQDNVYKFPNGSEIQLAGVDSGNAEGLRGGGSDLCLVDEAGFCTDLRYVVQSILLPTTMTTGGKVILASTPPKSAAHDFNDYVKEAKYRGTFVKKTIFDNPRFTKEQIDAEAEEHGGYGSVDFRREYLCVDENTLIKTYEGYKKIKDIKVGNLVFSHDKQYHKVLNKFKNPLGNRKVYKIKSSNNLGEIVTEGHKLLVTKTDYKRSIENSKTEWCEIQNIKNRPSERIYLKVPVDEMLEDHVNKDLAYLLGWYVAEGNVNKTQQQVIFSLSLHDPIEKIQQACNNYFGKDFVKYKGSERQGCIQWYLHSKKAKDIFKEFGTHSTRKTIPLFLKHANKEAKLEFLKAYFEGDGHYNIDQQSIKCSSVSKTLIFDLSDMLLSLGIGCQIGKVHSEGFSEILGRKVYINNSWSLQISGTNLEKFLNLKVNARNSINFVKDGYFYSRIKKIEEVRDYNKEFVYDLEVENSHSYVGVHTTFHNCEMITDEESAVVPEFKEDLQKEIIKEWKRPPFYDAYTSMDVGLIDLTVVLFAYYDFLEGKLVIEDEFVLNGAKMTSKHLSENIKLKEQELWTNPVTGEYKAPYLRVSDNNLILINDLQRTYNLTFIPTRKDEAEAALNNMRVMLAGKKIIINPRCKTLIFHLENATWNKARTKYDRSPDFGHFDACFTPEMKVITSEGIKEICNIQSGDLVLTHKGRFKKVKALLSREYSGEILKIKASGRPSISCTPDHKFWAAKQVKHQNRLEEKSVDWIEAKDLYFNKKGRTAGIAPLIKQEEPIKISKEMCFLYGYFVAEGSLGGNGSQINFAGHQKETKVVEILNEAILKEYGFNASGTSRRSKARHKKGEVLPRSFKGFKIRNSKTDNGRVILGSKKELYTELKKLGKSTTKKFPNWIYRLDEEQAFFMLCGYLFGDGHFSKVGIVASSISEDVIYGVEVLALICGISGNIRKISRKGRFKSFGTLLKNDSFGIAFSKEVSRAIIEKINQTYPLNNIFQDKLIHAIKQSSFRCTDTNKKAIQSKESCHYQGLVYSMEVEDDHSYTINGLAVKNCDSLKYLVRNVQYSKNPYPPDYNMPSGRNVFTSQYGSEQPLTKQQDGIKSLFVNKNQSLRRNNRY